LPLRKPQNGLKHHRQLHRGLEDGSLQSLEEAAENHGPERIRVGGVEQDHAGQAVLELRVVADKGLNDHAADAVTHQDDRLAPAEVDEGGKVLREGREAHRGAAAGLRLAEPRKIPEHQPEAIAQVLLGVAPERRVHPPPVGEED
jgi:hypothetical protein